MRKSLLLLLCLFSLAGHAQQEVIVWTYHLAPPFIIDRENREGLSYDFVELLNQHSDNRDRLHFRLIYLPRKRLDMHLHSGRRGLVLWVNPAFFNDAQSASYRWTLPLLHDQQDFLSRSDKPFDYHGPESLHGLTLGGVLGHRYVGIQDDIDQGLIAREDVPRDEQNLDKLLSKRIDLILIPHSTARFYAQQAAIGQQLYFSPTPLSRYSRQILLQPTLDQAVSDYIKHVVSGLEHNPDWQELLQKYGLD